MIKVTEEMVEAGLQHYSEGGCSGLADYERKEVVRDILEAALSAPAEPVGVGEPDPSAMRESENQAFHEWFKARGYPSYPELYSLTIENAMHAAWQEAAKRASLSALTPQSGAGTHSPVQHVELIAKLRTLTSNTGRDHRTGEEFVHGAGSQEVVDALRSALAALQGIPPVQHVAGGRWRVFEAATERGWWGIELEEAGNDDDPILYPVKIGRNRLDALVAAHNDAIASDGAEACAGEHQVVLDAIQSHNSGEDE